MARSGTVLRAFVPTVAAKAQLCMIAGQRTGIAMMFVSSKAGVEGEKITIVLELDAAGELAERMLAEIKRAGILPTGTPVRS